MRLAIGLPSFSSPNFTIPPGRFRRYVREADQRNFSGAYVLEHLAESPTYASSLLDPLTTLSYAAGETETLPLGTSVLLLPLRDPVLAAKRAATLQHLASRRLTLGLGTGYVEYEFETLDVPIEERGPRFREALGLIRRLFAEDRVTFDGEFYSVDDFRLEPAVDQPPRLLAAGDGTGEDSGREMPGGVLARFSDADGWLAPPRETDLLASDVDDLEVYLEREGREPGDFDRVALQYLHLVPGADDRRANREQRQVFGKTTGPDTPVEQRMSRCLTGSVASVRERVAAYQEMGFDELILHPLTTNPGELDRQLRLVDDLLQVDYP